MSWQIINHGLTIDDKLTSDELGFLCQDQNAVLRSVIKSFRQIMPQTPPLGFRPLYIFQRTKNEGPITDSTSDTNLYRIGLSVLDRCYNKMAYQFAHEFCHVYADPRITNWFIESVCEMMSQHILEHLSKTWETTAPFEHWRSYAPNFKTYLDDHLRKTHRKMMDIDDISIDRNTRLVWLRGNLSDLDDPINRERNNIIAESIRPIFRFNQNSWSMIPFLGRASLPYPKTPTEFVENSEFSFDKLQEIVPRNARKIVRQLRDILLL